MHCSVFCAAIILQTCLPIVCIYIYIYVAQRLGILQRAGSFGTGLDCLLLSTSTQ